jgi:16S rRNA (guanine(966)-N(2))-methyltransferase RsmD
MQIIGGAFKGRRLLPPPGRETRPITGSVKKSLFGMLGEDLTGMTVLDLYCGTGTLGLEAISRGAARCAFAELDRAVIARLKRNIEMVGASGRCVVLAGDVEANLASWLKDLGWKFGVAFVDPPYETARRWSWAAATDKVFAPLGGCLEGDGVVALRLPSQVEPPERLGPLAAFRLRRYGDMVLALLALEKENR